MLASYPKARRPDPLDKPFGVTSQVDACVSCAYAILTKVVGAGSIGKGIAPRVA